MNSIDSAHARHSDASHLYMLVGTPDRMLFINGSVMWTLPLVEPTHQANIAIFKDRFPNGPTTGAAVGAIFVGAAHNVAVESLP